MDNKENMEAEVKEEIKEEEIKEEVKEEAEEVRISPKLQKKRENREAKAARKAANAVEEKKSRPNNVLLALLIFGVLIGMFAFVKIYTYYSREASIETYIANNGGEETYGSMAIDMYTTANITAEGNSMKIVMDSTVDDEEAVKEIKEYYGDEKDGEDNLKYIGAYFLTTIKPQTRGLSADATVTLNINGEEFKTVSMTYKEAKELMEKDDEDEDEHDHEDEADEGDSDDSGDSGDSEDTGEAEEAGGEAESE